MAAIHRQRDGYRRRRQSDPAAQPWHVLFDRGNIIETGTDSYRLATTRARAERQVAG